MDSRLLLEGYRSRLIAVERRAALTVDAYLGELRRFLSYLDGKALEAAGVEARDLTAYLEHRSADEGVGPRSQARTQSALRSFFRHLQAEGLRKDNPAALLESPRIPHVLPEVLPDSQIGELLSLAGSDTPRGLRDRAIFELIYSCGLRVSEASGINLGDLSFSERLLRVRGKGGKERLVPFGAEAAKRLDAYLKASRPGMAKTPDTHKSPLFLSRTGRRLGRKGIWRDYRVYAQAVGAGSRVHALRHSFATEMVRGGANLRQVQELLGHANLTTTQIYADVDADLLRSQHARFLPKLGDLKR